MASKSSSGGGQEESITAEELAERLTDPGTAVTIDETVRSISDEGGDRVRRQVLRVRIVDQFDDE